MRRFALRSRLIGVAILAAALLIAPTAAAAPAAAAGITLPPANGKFDYQLGGLYKPSDDVKIVVRDRTVSPSPGRYNVCYVNAFQTQPGESASFAKKYPSLVLKWNNGKPVIDPNWPEEYLLDISTPTKRAQLATIVGAWFDGCKRKGYQAVEADNLDSFTRSRGKLDQADAIAFATLLVKKAHTSGLAIGQKNGAEFAATGKKIGFNFAITEECEVYRECGAYTRVYGNQVYEVEYSDNGASAYPRACRAQGTSISVIYRDRNVVPKGTPGYVYKVC
jgi:hypothetical protein